MIGLVFILPISSCATERIAFVGTTNKIASALSTASANSLYPIIDSGIVKSGKNADLYDTY